MPELRKSAWLGDYLKIHWPTSTFLNEFEDKSALVDNDKIHMAEIGCNPDVMLDNTVFPIPVQEFTDNPVEVSLRWANTKNTVVRSITQAARKQDLRKEYIKIHKIKLAKELLKLAAHSVALSTVDAAKGNVIVEASGEARATELVKMVKFEDVLAWRATLDTQDVPADEVNIVFDAKHLNDLRLDSLRDYKDLMEGMGEGKMNNLFRAKVHTYSQNPHYDIGTDAKLAFGGTVTANHERASLMFVKSNSIKAFGSVDMFANMKDAYAQGDVFHFLQRFLAVPKQDKYRSILISKTA